MCNLVYKLILRIIAKSLKGILFGVILDEQLGCLFDRKIHNSMGTTIEGMLSTKN